MPNVECRMPNEMGSQFFIGALESFRENNDWRNDLALRVYNTLTKTKQPFKPVEEGKVRMYLCGMTVYKPPHIGHLVGPVIFDAIRRHLSFQGYKVNWLVNITDVDDKLIEKARELNTSVEQLAKENTEIYLRVLRELDVHISGFPKASEHMGEIVRICQGLIDKGFAYAAEGNVWFDVTKDSDYGKLSNRKVEEQEAGLRATEGAGKRNPADFALWKAVKPGEPAWDSPWGKGRPGWHIECSAMCHKHLGDTLDIHGGGMDLMFPHHKNEIAQSESYTGKPLANVWMHNGLTKIKTKLASGEWRDEKMSGSIGNVVSAEDLLKEHGPELLRYFLLSTHYRSPIEFTPEALGNAKKALAGFYRLFERVGRLKKTGKELDQDFAATVTSLRQKFLDAMDDDFNTGAAIGVLHEWAGEINSYITRTNVESTGDAFAATSAVEATNILRGNGLLILGLFRETFPFAKPKADDSLTDGLMQLLIALRNDARKSKNFALADSIRKGLSELKITLEDRPDGTHWRKD
jgi:cysteinyl-tRNA synthetase